MVTFTVIKFVLLYLSTVTCMSKKLLSPLKFHDLILKNRIALAPLTRSRNGPDKIPKPWMVDYYVQRASAGLIIAEATLISNQAQGFNNVPGIFLPEHVQGWRTITDSVHKVDGVIFSQLWHMGRVSHSSYSGFQPIAPSAVVAQGEGLYDVNFVKVPYETPRALAIDEIPNIVNEYKQAAICAKEAGFDGIELHAANGYLMDIFLQSHTNLRTDAYGGSPEKRFRFIREVIESVCSVFPSTSIGIRLSPNGVYNDMGNADNFDTFLYYMEQLNQFNLGYLHVMDGLGFGFHNKCAQVTLKDVRKVYKGIVIGNCGYTPATAEEAVACGDADMIAIGRAYISNPDLPERIANDWPLAESDPSTYYSSPAPDWDPRKGYTDYPIYSPK